MTGPAWAWYSIQSFWMGRGYLMALTVPVEVPMKSARPERDMATVVQTTSLVRTSLRICSKNINTHFYLEGSFMVLFNQKHSNVLCHNATNDIWLHRWCVVRYDIWKRKFWWILAFSTHKAIVYLQRTLKCGVVWVVWTTFMGVLFILVEWIIIQKCLRFLVTMYLHNIYHWRNIFEINTS